MRKRIHCYAKAAAESMPGIFLAATARSSWSMEGGRGKEEAAYVV